MNERGNDAIGQSRQNIIFPNMDDVCIVCVWVCAKKGIAGWKKKEYTKYIYIYIGALFVFRQIKFVEQFFFVHVTANSK